mgnify:FL=1
MAKKDKSKKDKKKKGKEKKAKKGKEKKAPAGNGDLGEIRSLTGSIALSKLTHVMMTKKGKKGKVKGLFIPIKQNYLTEGKEGAVYLNLRVRVTENHDQYGQNGFIAHSADSTMYKEAKDKEKEKMGNLPIMGNIKDWESSGEANDNSGKAGDKDSYDEEDDLPF